MAITSKQEEHFFGLSKKWPKTYNDSDGYNEEELELLRRYEMINQQCDLFSCLNDLKNEVLRNATHLLQTGANERLIYLKSLLNRTESTINETNSSFVIWDPRGFGAKYETKYDDLKAGQSQHIEFLKEAKEKCKELENFLKAELTGQPEKKDISKLNDEPKKKGNTKNTFKDLFKKKDDYDKALTALRHVSPAIINDKGHYCLGPKSKGAIVAFVAVLKMRSLIEHLPEIELAPLLNENFPQLNITDRSLRNVGTKFYRRYYSDLLALIK